MANRIVRQFVLTVSGGSGSGIGGGGGSGKGVEIKGSIFGVSVTPSNEIRSAKLVLNSSGVAVPSENSGRWFKIHIDSYQLVDGQEFDFNSLTDANPGRLEIRRGASGKVIDVYSNVFMSMEATESAEATREATSGFDLIALIKESGDVANAPVSGTTPEQQ